MWIYQIGQQNKSFRKQTPSHSLSLRIRTNNNIDGHFGLFLTNIMNYSTKSNRKQHMKNNISAKGNMKAIKDTHTRKWDK